MKFKKQPVPFAFLAPVKPGMRPGFGGVGPGVFFLRSPEKAFVWKGAFRLSPGFQAAPEAEGHAPAFWGFYPRLWEAE